MNEWFVLQIIELTSISAINLHQDVFQLLIPRNIFYFHQECTFTISHKSMRKVCRGHLFMKVVRFGYSSLVCALCCVQRKVLLSLSLITNCLSSLTAYNLFIGSRKCPYREELYILTKMSEFSSLLVHLKSCFHILKWILKRAPSSSQHCHHIWSCT